MADNRARRSLFVTLGIIIFSTVLISMIVNATYRYTSKRVEIIEKMHYDSNLSVVSLQKNIAGFIASYAINEYDKQVLYEMEGRDIFAIVVEDYNMGRIFGTAAYISGKIRGEVWDIIDYNPLNKEHQKQLTECFYSETHDIKSVAGEKLGAIKICISSHKMDEQLNSIIISTIFNTVVISILLITLLFLIMRIFILRPLQNMVAVISDSDEDGIPNKLVPHYGSKEFYTLSMTMNKMICAIKSSRVALKKQQAALHFQANHDALTGLANRSLFSDRLEQGLKRSKRNQQKLALLFIDLDHFKEVNDLLGHSTGDEVLKIATHRLEQTIRVEDTLARLGGDEFIIMLEGLQDGSDIAKLASKILKILAEPILINDNVFYVGCSIGISIYPDNGEEVQDLLKYADTAMYRAKNRGRNNYQYYSEDMTAHAFEKLNMESNLRIALKNQEFIVYYQPQVDGRTNQLTGVEALVRWQNPSMGLISPARFIPVAESIGLMTEIDEYVMELSMQQMVDWYQKGLNPGVLALNLTVKHLQKRYLLDSVMGYMQATGCKAEWLEFEVAEGQVMTQPEEIIKILHQIHESGISIALDDFGTGYSSLSYLKKLPINKLKIDRSFVTDLPDDEDDISIVMAIIALAENLNMDIIAEGVETIEQKEFLVEHGCQNIQGYYYAKPMSAEELEILLKDGFVL